MRPCLAVVNERVRRGKSIMNDRLADDLLVDDGRAAPRPLDPLRSRLSAALRRHWKDYRRAFKQCRRKLSEGSVHKLRVEGRRLMSLLHLVDPLVSPGLTEKVHRRFKKILNALAPLRDTQVQLAGARNDERCSAEWRAFRKMLRRREAKLNRRINKRLVSTRLKTLKTSLREVQDAVGVRSARFERQDRELVVDAVERAFAAARRRDQAIDRTDLTTIHRARIAFKKFRYMVEALQEVFPGLTTAGPKKMQAYQTIMGRIQDAEVLRDNWRKLYRKKNFSRATFEAQQAELLLRRARRVADFLAVKDTLRTFWPAGAGRLESVVRRARSSHS